MSEFRSHIIILYRNIPNSNDWLVVSCEFHHSPSVSWSDDLELSNLSFRCARNNVPAHRAALQALMDVHDPLAARTLPTLADTDFTFLDAT